MAYTSFFRDADVLDAIGTQVVPWVSAQQEIKIWDPGCATGEEAYSLAMIFAERLDPFTIRNLRIVATDREESSFPQFESKIPRGRYHRQDLMRVPEPLRSRREFAPSSTRRSNLSRPRFCTDTRSWSQLTSREEI